MRTTGRPVRAARQPLLVIFLLAVLLAGGTASARPAAVPPRVIPDKLNLERHAAARWLVPTSVRHEYRELAVEVLGHREARDSDERLLLFTIKGECRVEEHESGWGMSCRGRGAIRSLPADSFEMDPMLRSAELDVRAGRQRFQVGWTASNPLPGIYEAYEVCISNDDSGEGRGGGLFHPASAEGKAFGHRLATDLEYESAELSSGVMLTECDSPWVERVDWERVLRGEVVRVARTSGA